MIIAVVAALCYFYLFEKEISKHLKNQDKFVELENLNVYEISKLGLSFIPSDRHKHGLVLDYNIKYNTILRRLW
ncbi:sugar ABC transporter ATP-binding protein MGLA, partial [Mycoplasmopsis edwardii]